MKTQRDLTAEIEMQEISEWIWCNIGIGKMPKIQSKKGGSSGCYYEDIHTVFYRSNVWNKLPLAGKRMLAIHELYHAAGHHHDSTKMFCHSFDILTLELYKLIYGEDDYYKFVITEIKDLAYQTIKYSKNLSGK